MSTDPADVRRPQPVRSGVRVWLGGNHLVRGSLVMLVGSAASALAGYVYWTFLSRRFGASVVGEVAALGAVAAVVSLLNAHSLGASILSRLPSLSPGSQRALLRAAVLLVGVLAALGAAVGWVLLLLGSDGSFLRDPGLFVVFVVGVAAQSIGSTLDMASLALRSSGLAAVRNGASSLLRLPILAAFAAFLGAFGGLAAALLTSTIVSLLSVLWLVRSLARVLPETGHPVALSDVVGELRRGAGAQTLVALGTGAPAQLLPALVVAFAGATAGGHFSIAWLVGSTCFMIPPMVCSSLLTEAARDLDALGRRVRHASALIALLLTPPVVAYLLAGERILTLFGDGFATGGSGVLTVLALSALPNTAMHVSVSVLRVHEHLRRAAAVSLLGGGATMGAALLLIPVLGASGAGAGWLIGQAVGALAGVRSWRRIPSPMLDRTCCTTPPARTP